MILLPVTKFIDVDFGKWFIEKYRPRSVEDVFWICKRHMIYSRQICEDWDLPRVAWRLGFGDCEELANITTSILRAMGIDAWSRIAIVRTREGLEFHVFTIFNNSCLDLTLDRPFICPDVVHIVLDFNEKLVRIYDKSLAKFFLFRPTDTIEYLCQQ